MSILSDIEIAALSTKPKFVIFTGEADKPTSRQFYVHDNVEEFVTKANKQSFGTDNYLEMLAHPQSAQMKPFWVNYREVTEEDLIASSWKPLISPFLNEQQRMYKDASGNDFKGISRGLSSYGYDVTLSNKFKLFTDINSTVIDPLDFKDNSYADYEGEVCILPPNSYALALTEEVFSIPRDVIVMVLNKSTYARSGINVTTTIIEPEQGKDEPSKIVLEIANLTPLPAKLYAGMGIAQFVFLKGNVPCQVSYADRGGKYGSQQEIVTPKV